jgi:hypothetical protein
MWADLAIRGSIAAATLSWAAAESVRWRDPSRGATARALWTSGAGLTLVHALAVFHYNHQWSHAAALAHTAQQTAALTGLHWGGGLYVNYAFIALWVGDAVLWWRDRPSYERRSRASRDALLALFVFMFVNGGIVFASGPARAIGILAVGLVAWARWGSAAPAQPHTSR